jgi:hypothetical protein
MKSNVAGRWLLIPILVGYATTTSFAFADSPDEAKVRVHIDSPTPVQLMKHDVSRNSWDETACNSPCDADIRVGEYRIEGQSIMRSSAFEIAPAGHDVTIHVDPSKKAVAIGGGATAAVGVGIGIVGIFLAAGVSGAQIGDERQIATSSTSKAVGVGMIIGGVALIAIGTILCLPNLHSGAALSGQASSAAGSVPWDSRDLATGVPMQGVERPLPTPTFFNVMTRTF